ncbi:complement decay-accelerating factor-like isoform X10 [Oncorhynchus masou masou]|uniref:complement decay-accelerating factor-like isoform X10 n=1 Tax=Oncorhynchus masou masou TaxID=90313 RepID=UPI0031831832
MFCSNAWTKCLICLIFLTSGNEKDCGAPRKMPHLTYEFKEGTLFGASARAICDKGYQLMGPSYRQCYAIGWSGRPRCKVVTCDKPPEIMHGTIIEKPGEELPEYGGVIQYSCNEGYTLIGNKSIECIEDGEYNSLPPECKDVNDILLKPTTISTSSITTTSTVLPTIRDVNGILLKPTTISTSSITTTSTVLPTIKDVNDILLKPTTISTSSITTTSTVPPTIKDVNDILLKPTTISTSSITTTSTVPPTIRDVNGILLKPTTKSTSSITTTSTVPPTIKVSGRNNGVGEHDINAATEIAAVVGSGIGTVIRWVPKLNFTCTIIMDTLQGGRCPVSPIACSGVRNPTGRSAKYTYS